MKRTLKRKLSILLPAAVLALGAASAQAATGFWNGYSIRPGQESMITPGMTEQQVLQTLGHPLDRLHYFDQSGSTWRYQVNGEPSAKTLFDVDFNAHGQVAGVSQVQIPMD